MVDTKFKKGLVPWNKGIPMRKESKRKLSESHKGKPSPMKGKKTGKPAWNRGISPSEESRKRMSESQKRVQTNPEVRRKMVEARKKNDSYKHTEEQKRKIGLANKGRKVSAETKKKISLAQKEVWTSPNFKKRMKKIWTGRKHSEESKKRMSESHKNISDETRKKMGLAGKGRIPWNKNKKGIMPAPWNKGKKMPERSEWGRQNILKQYESGKFPQQENTKPERQIKEELVKRKYIEGIDFIHQYKFMNKFMCDFCFPQQKIIVEIYGDFWHANPKKYPDQTNFHAHQIKDIRKDKAKEAYITTVDNRSWTYLIVWEMDIKENVSKCVDIIEKVLDQKRVDN